MLKGVCSWGIFLCVGILSLFFSNIAVGTMTLGRRQRLKTGKPVFSTGAFTLTLLPLYIMVAFTDSGVDYYTYYRIIINHHSLQDIFGFSKLEPLFNLGSYLAITIFNNPHVLLFLLKSAAILIFFSAFYIARYKVYFPLAVFAYLATIYPGTFYIIRQNLSAALVCLAFVQSIIQNKKIKPVILMIIAVGFHYTAAIFLGSFFIYLTLESNLEKKARSRFFFVLFAFIIFVIFLRNVIEVASVVNVNVNYGKFFENESTRQGSGILQIAFYLPAFFSIYYLFKNEENRDLLLLSTIIVGICFLCAQAGYVISAFIRMRYYATVVFSIIIPYVYQNMLDNSNPKRFRSILIFRRKSYYLLLMMYLIMRFYLTYTDLLAIDNDSQMYWYHFTIDILFQ